MANVLTGARKELKLLKGNTLTASETFVKDIKALFPEVSEADKIELQSLSDDFMFDIRAEMEKI